MKKLMLALSCAWSFAGVAATSYVVPWYVNPAAKVKLWSGVDGFNAVDLRFGEKGDRLFALLNVSGGARAIAYDMSPLASLSGVQTNWHNGVASYPAALPASARAAVSSVRDAYLAINPSEGTGAEAPAGHARWIGRFAPTALSFGSGAVAATSFAFDATGHALWSNSTAAGDKGKLVKWIRADATFAPGTSVDSGLSSVQAVAVYTVDGTEYVVAATQGSVRFVNAASGSVKFTVSDPTHLGSSVRAVRMSHCDHFRPRLYVLFDTGDVAAYYLDRELTKATWSKTNANAGLLAAAGAPFAATAAKIVAFDVTPDGGTAAVGYAQNAGDASTPTGPAYVTLLRHEPRKWILYDQNQEGNPFKGQFSTMTDGEWVLKFHWHDGGEVWVGASSQNVWNQRAWTSDEMPEYLDFSHGYSYKAANNERHPINGNEQYAFATNALGKGPRVLLHSPTMTFFNDRAKRWSGEGNYEEIVIDAPTLTWGASWSGPDVNTKFFIYNFPALGNFPTWMIYPNNGGYFGAEGRWEDQNMASASKIGYRTWSHMDPKGVLDVPKAVSLSNECFSVCRNMAEAKLGYAANSLKELWGAAFKGCTSLKRVTLDGAGGFTFYASDVFADCPLEEVTFTGGVPTFRSGISVAWPDAAEKTMAFAVPRGNAAWEAILADPSKVKNRLSLAEQQAYHIANPGKYVPVGVLDKSVLLTKYDQYVAYGDMKGGVTLEIERDAFFDDEIEVTSDWAPAADGTYLPGTQVTLTAKPNATGTFVRWYGDVSRAAETDARITVTLKADTWLYCRIVHPWTLSSDKTKLTNGNFTLNCGVRNEGARTLCVGTAAKYGLYAADDVGTGVVDLGGPITRAGTSEKWTVVKIPDYIGGCMCAKRGDRGSGATTLVFPGTFTEPIVGQWMHCSVGDKFGKSYRTLIMDEPKVTGNPFPPWATCGHYDLSRFVLRIPKATNFSADQDPCFWNISASGSKFDWWDLSSVSAISARALFGYDWNNGNRLKAAGKLTLPSYCVVTNSLCELANVEEISLGGLTKAKAVTSIAAGAMTNDPRLRKLTIHNDRNLSVAKAGVFTAGQVPQEIVLTGPAPANDFFANLLGSVTAAATKPIRVSVSKYLGWNVRPAWLDAPTDAERAEAPGEEVLGVYRGGAAAPSGKALVIHRASPFDPKGGCILLR